MMNLKYQLANSGCRMRDIRFCSSLTGCERITTLKQSLDLLIIKNPAVDFTNDVKAGVYDSLSDQDYYRLLHTIEHISGLWKYPDASLADQKESMQPEMNVLMLLAHAIQEIAVLDALLWDIGYYKEEERK